MKNYKLKVTILIIFLGTFFGAYYYFNPTPAIVVNDQPIQNGKFTFDKVNLREDAWLVLYSRSKYSIVEEVGKVLLKKGRNKDVGVFVNVSKTTPQIEAVLYNDLGALGAFDIAADTPMMIKNKPFTLIFNKL